MSFLLNSDWALYPGSFCLPFKRRPFKLKNSCFPGISIPSQSGLLLTLCMLSKISADDIFKYVFHIFSRKQVLTFHANCLLGRQFVWSDKAYFCGKNINLSSAEFSNSMVSVKERIAPRRCGGRNFFSLTIVPFEGEAEHFFVREVTQSNVCFPHPFPYSYWFLPLVRAYNRNRVPEVMVHYWNILHPGWWTKWRENTKSFKTTITIITISMQNAASDQGLHCHISCNF